MARPYSVQVTPADTASLLDNLQKLSSFFDGETKRRGAAYERDGMVCNLEGRYHNTNFILNATVLGTAAYKSQIAINSLDWSPDNLSCTCPVGQYCKHLYAIVVATQKTLAENPLNSPSEIVGHTAIGQGSAKIFSWLKKQSSYAKTDTLPSTTYILGFYLRNSPYSKGRLLLQVLAVPDDWQGDSRMANISVSEAFRKGKLRLTAVESSLFGRIFSSLNETIFLGYEAVNLESRPGQADILSHAVATGRCYLEGTHQAPLRIGPPVEVEPAWNLKQHKAYAILNLKNESTSILKLDRCVYLDRNNLLLGEVQSTAPGIDPRFWLDAPPIPRHEFPVVSAALKKSGLPALGQEREDREIVQGTLPIPILIWYDTGRQWPSYYERETVSNFPVLAAELAYEYAGIRILSAEQKNYVEDNSSGDLRYIERVPHREQERKKDLVGMGIMPLGSCPLVHGIKTKGQMGFSAYGKEHALQLWKNFMRSGRAELLQKGWKIEFRKGFADPLAYVDAFYVNVDESADNAWFSGDLGVEINGEKISLVSFLPQLLEQDLLLGKTEDMAIQFRGKTVIIPRERMQALMRTVRDVTADPENNKLQMPAIRAADLLKSLESIDGNWSISMKVSDLLAKIKAFQGIRPVQTSASLKTKLRDYQGLGLSWLQGLDELGLGGILADDMGLGKTVQVIAFLLAVYERNPQERPSLIIAPTSVIPNWQHELQRFGPSLSVTVLHGKDRGSARDALGTTNIVLTSYAIALRDKQYLGQKEFYLIAADEAQQIKNALTKSYQAICQLKACLKISVTGTPLENNLGELWAHYNLTIPGLLPDHKTFKKFFRTPIEKYGDNIAKEILAERIKPFLLRRTKEEVAKELPSISETITYVELAREQRDLYESVRSLMNAKVREALQRKGAARTHIEFLDALLKLRQVCCDPRLVKLRKASTLTESAKLDALMDLVRPLVAEKRKVLVFSQFTSMLDIIEAQFNEEGIAYCSLRGSTKDRSKPVTEFQQQAVPVFLISLKAGGTGLNLTAADTVILYDPWWNPAVEEQAIARAHRIGQTKPVFVYKLVVRGSIEEKILELHKKKKGLVEGLLTEGDTPQLKLTSELLTELFAPLS